MKFWLQIANTMNAHTVSNHIVMTASKSGWFNK